MGSGGQIGGCGITLAGERAVETTFMLDIFVLRSEVDS
jgi:hypothetical protein